MTRSLPLRTYLTRLIWLCMLPLLLLAAYLAGNHVLTQQAERDATAGNLAQNFATVIDQDLNARIDALGMLAMSPLVDHPGRWRDLYQEALGFQRNFGSHVVFADRDMHMLFNTRTPYGTALPELPRPQGHAAAPTAMATGKPAVGDLFFGPVAKEPLVAVAVPVMRRGTTAFLLITVFESRQFQQRLDQVALPPDWALSLLDSRGEVIARRAPAGFSPDADGSGAGRFVVGSARSPWSVVLEIPRHTYRAPLILATTAMTLAILVASLIGLFGGRRASRRLADAVAALAVQPAPGTALPDILEIAAVQRLLSREAASRAAAETARLASEQRLEATFEQAAVGIALVAPDGRWLRANRALCEITGYSQDELRSLSFHDLDLPGQDDDRDGLRRLLAGETRIVSREQRYLRKNGHPVWVHLSVTLVNGPDARPEHFIAVIEDIQARKRAETALKDSEAALIEAQRQAGIGSWRWDPATDQPVWSAEMYRIFDCDPAQPLAQFADTARFFTPESWARLSAAVANTLAGGLPYECDAEVVRADGSHRWVVSRGEAVQGDGRVIALRGTVQDITERKEAEAAWHARQTAMLEEQHQARLAALNLMEDAQAARVRAETAHAALQESETKYRLLAENSTDCIMWRGTDGRYRYVSPACATLTGHGVDEFLADPGLMTALVHPEQRTAYRQHVLDDRHADLIEMEFRIQRKDGALRWISHICKPLQDEHGELVGRRVTNRDITDKKLAEQSLHESASRYRTLLDNLPQIIWHKDRASVYVNCNAAYAHSLGVEPEALPGRTDFDFYPAELAAKYRADDQRILAGGVIESLDERWQVAGEERFVHTTKVPLLDDRGEAYGTLGIAEDITERKRAESALQRERDRNQQYLDTMQTFMVALDEQGRITMINRAGCALLGYEEAELLGRDWFETCLPEDIRATVKTTFRQVVAGHLAGAEYYDNPVLCRDGRQRLIGWHNALLVDAAGRIAGSLSAGQDITESRRAEEQLRKLAQAVEQSPESIAITNLEAEIEYVNEAFVQNTGYSREEVIGQNPRILHSGQTPKETYEELWGALAAGRPWKGEFHNKRKDGSEYVEFAIITPIRQPDGRISHYVAVKEDITEKKRMGEELDHYRHHLEELVADRTAELEAARAVADAASMAKSAFLANMSHEIRTPMNAIVGLTYLLRQGALTPEQRGRLDKIDNSAQHLLAIINDILDLSKIEAGRMELEQTDFALESVLDHVSSLVADQARAKGLAIVVEHDGVPLWLRGDPTRLRQAMLNYAGNAIKFTDQGTVWLRARLLDEDQDGLLVRFEVEDTGIGIAEETLPTLFDLFTQADASTTRKYGGSGLGLVITRRLAHMMAGEAGAESVSGPGQHLLVHRPAAARSWRDARRIAAPADGRRDPAAAQPRRRPPAAGRGQSDQPRGRPGTVARGRPLGGHGGKRPRGPGQDAQPALRPGPDGRADAGHGRRQRHPPGARRRRRCPGRFRAPAAESSGRRCGRSSWARPTSCSTRRRGSR